MCYTTQRTFENEDEVSVTCGVRGGDNNVDDDEE